MNSRADDMTTSSVFSQLVRLSDTVLSEDTHDWCDRALNFMVYEMQARTAGNTSPSGILNELISYFFSTKNFEVTALGLHPKTALAEKRGSGILVSVFFCQVARLLGLDARVLHWPPHTVIRVKVEGGCSYIDLRTRGDYISEDGLLTMIQDGRPELQFLAGSQVLLQFLQYLTTSLRHSNQNELLHRALNEALELDTHNTRLLAERALLRKELGLIKESHQDFKRYFSFVDPATASPELVAHFELVRTQSQSLMV